MIVYAQMMRPTLAIVLGTFAFAVFIGTPHIGWDYRCAYKPGFGHLRKFL